MNLTSPIQLTPSQTNQTLAATDTNSLAEGTVGVTYDGRMFRWAKAGGTNLVVGNVLQAAAEIADHKSCSVTTTAAGATALVITPGATGGAANLYAGGIALVSTAATLGYAYGIASHAAITASVAFTLNLRADDPVVIALTTSNKITLVANAYKAVIQSPITTLTGSVVGVAVSAIPANGWGWIQTKGIASVLTGGTPGPGVAVVVPGTAAGNVVVDGATAATQVVGSSMVTAVDGTCCPIFLNLP